MMLRHWVLVSQLEVLVSQVMLLDLDSLRHWSVRLCYWFSLLGELYGPPAGEGPGGPLLDIRGDL